jgi:hypothetical protein
MDIYFFYYGYYDYINYNKHNWILCHKHQPRGARGAY